MKKAMHKCIQVLNMFSSRTLEEFIVIARGGEKFTQSVIKDDKYNAGVKHITISWEPAKSDIGNHLICVRAVDNTGYGILYKIHFKRVTRTLIGTIKCFGINDIWILFIWLCSSVWHAKDISST